MRHRKRQLKLGKKPAHVRAIITNQVCSLIQEERIKTTIQKAKATRSLAEKMVTLAKRGDLHNRRRAIARLHNQDAVRKLFNEIGPRFTDRAGGYTRIVHIGQRRGDGAKIVYLEWIGAQEVPATKQRRQPEPEETEEVIDEVEATEEEVVEEAAESAEESAAEAEEASDDVEEATEEAEAPAEEAAEEAEAEAPAEEEASEDDEEPAS